MDFHIIGVDKNLVQIQVDDLLHLGQGAAVEHFLCLPERCADCLLVQIIFLCIPFLFLNLDIQQLFLPLQLGKLSYQRSTARIGNDIDNVGDFLLYGFQILAKGTNLFFIFPILLLAQLPVRLHDSRNPRFIKDDFFNLPKHQLLQRFLMDIGVAAGMGTVVFPVIAEVGADHASILFTPGLHRIAAISVTAEAAKYHAGQQIFPLPIPPPVALSASENCLHTGKGVIVHNFGHPAGNTDLIFNGFVQMIVPPPQLVLACRPAKHIDAIVLFIPQHLIQCFLGEGIAQPGAVAHGIQLVQNYIVTAAIGYIPEDHSDRFRLIVIVGSWYQLLK